MPRINILISSLLFIGSLVVGSFFLAKVHVSNHIYHYFTPNHPAVLEEKKLHQEFLNDYELLLVFRHENILGTEFLQRLQKFVQAVESLPEVKKVISPTNADQAFATIDGLEIDPLINIDELENLGVAGVRSRLDKSIIARDLLFSKDYQNLALTIIPSDVTNDTQLLATHQKIFSLLDQYAMKNFLQATSGVLHVTAVDKETIEADTNLLIPISSIVGMIILWLMFRSVSILLYSGLIYLVNVVVCVSLHGIFGWVFTSTSQMIPTLIMALATAFLAHFFAALQKQLQLGTGQDREAAVTASIKKVLRPAFFSGITTMAGFSTMATSSIPANQHLGMIVIFGIAFMFWNIYYWLPPLITKWCPMGRPPAIGNFLQHTIIRFPLRWALARPKTIIGVNIIFFLLTAPIISSIYYESNFINFFAPNHPLRIDNNYINQHLAGSGRIAIAFSSTIDEAFKAPERLQALDSFVRWVQQQPEVGKVVSFPHFVRDMHWAFNGEQPEFRTIPNDGNLIAQYLLMSGGKDLYDLVNRDYNHTLVNLSLKINSSTEIEALIKRIDTYLKSHSIPDASFSITGIDHMANLLLQTLKREQKSGALQALLLILFIMLYLFRSFLPAVISLIPNIVPILVVFIVMGLFKIPLDFATTSFVSIVLGIAIDDTIHIILNYHQQLQKGFSAQWSLCRTYLLVGKAIVTTTLVLVFQYLVFTVATYTPVYNFGLLLSIGIASALWFDLLLLPALLLAFQGTIKPMRKKIGRSQEAA